MFDVYQVGYNTNDDYQLILKRYILRIKLSESPMPQSLYKYISRKLKVRY